jgi:hypothetical protein
LIVYIFGGLLAAVRIIGVIGLWIMTAWGYVLTLGANALALLMIIGTGADFGLTDLVTLGVMLFLGLQWRLFLSAKPPATRARKGS